jgi:hypothetical protein
MDAPKHTINYCQIPCRRALGYAQRRELPMDKEYVSICL